VAGDVVGVSVRLEHPHEAEIAALALGEHALDGQRRIDHDGLPRLLVADEVARTAEIVVDELTEEHAATLASRAASFLEAPPSQTDGRPR
jgi:hypothetical protein